jgi:alpha-galactosidase
MFILRAAALNVILCLTLALPVPASKDASLPSAGKITELPPDIAIATLQNSDTILKLSGVAGSPRVVNLSSTACPQVWQNQIAETLPAAVELDGKQIPVSWKLNVPLCRVTKHIVSYVYECSSPHLRLAWEWRTRADFGPAEHRMRIDNLDNKEYWLVPPESFSFNFKLPGNTPVTQMYIDKGAGKPSEVGVHHLTVEDGYKWTGTSSTYAEDVPEGTAREIIPWLLLQRADGLKSGWYSGIEFSGRTRMALERVGGSLAGVIGLNPKPLPCKTCLRPGKSFETPQIFLGAACGSEDAVANLLHRWFKRVYGNPVAWKDPAFPPVTNNTWGVGMGINEERATRMLRAAAELGIELFHVDAGWFRGVGDWYADPGKFPHGLASLAEEVHKLGLKFGLWINWSQSGLNTEETALNVHKSATRNWLVADVSPSWKIDEFRGRTIDIGYAPAHDWAAGEVERVVREYHLDMLEHDGYLVAQGCERGGHPHAEFAGERQSCNDSPHPSVDRPNSTDVSYHAVRAYYDIQERLRRNYPGLLLEVCNDGGRMVDFGSAAQGDYFSITDSYDPLSNRRAFYDASYLFPPAMLECYVQRTPTPTLDSFRYVLRSGMMGWFSVMQDTTEWTKEQHQAAAAEVRLYRDKLRPLLRAADLYHISNRPDGVGWDGVEYYDSTLKKGAVYAFRGSSQTEGSHVFKLQGLSAGAKYRLKFNDCQSEVFLPGARLLQEGLPVELAAPETSELIFLEALK